MHTHDISYLSIVHLRKNDEYVTYHVVCMHMFASFFKHSRITFKFQLKHQFFFKELHVYIYIYIYIYVNYLYINLINIHNHRLPGY